MSITTIGLIESLLLHDRPAAWWGLDTADPLTDDSVFDTDATPYTLTALGTPTNSASLHTRGDTGASGCRDFNGTTGGYFVAGSLYETNPEPPQYVYRSGHSASGGGADTPIFAGSAYGAAPDTPGYGAATANPALAVGDLMVVALNTAAAAATITSAPAGWTQVGSTINYVQGSMAIYRRTATQADVDGVQYVWTWSASADHQGIIGAWRNCDPDVATLIFDFGLQATSSSTDHSTTTETVPPAAKLIVIWAGDGQDIAYQPQLEGELRLAGVLNSAFGSGTCRTVMLDYEVHPDDPQGVSKANTSTATQLGAAIITFGAPDVAVRDTLDTISEKLSVHFLMNADTLSGTDTILSKHQAYHVDCSGTTLRFRYRDGAGADQTVNGPTLSTGVTRRVWVRDDGTNIYFTVNGTTTSAARTGAAGYTQNTNRVCIGHTFDGATTANFYDGRLDEMAIFPTFVSLDMVTAHETAATQGTFGDYMTANQSGGFPRGKVELALDSDPTALCHAFTDVTSDIRRDGGIQRTSGRNFESDRVEAGTFSLVLNNRETTYDDLLATRPIRFRVQTATDQPVIPRFFGYTDAPSYQRPARAQDSIVALNATDVFKALSLEVIEDDFQRGEELIGERIRALLADVDGLLSSIDDGVHRLAAAQYQNSNRLEGVQAAVESDGGVFYCDGRGRLVFTDNQHRTKNERTLRATYGWRGTTATFPSGIFTPIVDEARLFTGAAVTPASGDVQTASNAAAIRRHFRRTKQLTTLHADDLDAQAAAQHFTDAYSQRLERVNSLVLQPLAHSSPATMWASVLAHNISHRIKTVEKPTGASVETAREHFIEGISETVTAKDWLVSVSLSPVELDGSFFIVGTSQIGGTNGIGW